MNLLFTIAHFFDPGGGAFYGSTGPNAQARLQSLRNTITALHQHFGDNQAKLIQTGRTVLEPVNVDKTNNVQVMVATTGDQHLLGELGLSTDYYEHAPTDAEGMHLGFECQKLLRDRLGDFDFYCYLEDDLILQDADFFTKLSWFASHAPADAVLLPNRFELAVGEEHNKLYIDGGISPAIASRWQNIDHRHRIRGKVMGHEIRFEKTNNPHSGCYFLNEGQMRAWCDAPHFLDYDTAFGGPLESAATLGLMKSFHLYKPAARNASFLEVHHSHNRYLGQPLKFNYQADGS
ncbi:MAG: calcium-binding protein [Alphaproteobacteria bacterium]|nr:calcium-binding protein [Alphaproteobacteria bacterium]